MTLHTIGYAALSYPDLPSELPIPLGNQVGVLQRQPFDKQSIMMAQIASQYLPALLAFQSGPNPALNDPAHSQHFLNDALVLLNWLSSNPDVAKAAANHPTLLHDKIEMLLSPTLEADMKRCDSTRRGGATFDADLGSILQFVSALLLRKDSKTLAAVHPRIQDLVPILEGWTAKYQGKFIAKPSERLISQIQDPDSADYDIMRQIPDSSLRCGYFGCENNKDMKACGQCKVQRYCTVEHQKKDWKLHKKICSKGLIVEDTAS